MKVAIDLRALQIGHEYRGIGTYLKNVLPRLTKKNTSYEFIFLRYKSSNPITDLGLDSSSYVEVFDEISSVEHYKPNIFLQPDQNLGFPSNKKIKKYLIVYDLIPLILRDDYLPHWKNILLRPGISRKQKPKLAMKAWLNFREYNKGLKNIKKADKIFSISNSTTNDVVKMLKVPSNKIVTTPLGSTISNNISIKAPKGFPKRNRYLLFIGGVDKRRQIVNLINAFNRINGRGFEIDLVLAGKELGKANEIPNDEGRTAIINSSYRDQIHLLGYISDSEKAWLYKNAFAFIYPTLYEGFGLPVLEAMSLNCPVITYKTSSLPEITGDSAIMLDSRDQHGIFNAIAKLEDPNFRKVLAGSGFTQSKKFSWEKCVDLLFNNLN